MDLFVYDTVTRQTHDVTVENTRNLKKHLPHFGVKKDMYILDPNVKTEGLTAGDTINIYPSVKAKLLIKGVADTEDSWFETNDFETMSLLLETGIDINVRNDKSKTRLYMCTCEESNIDTLRFLLERGADVDAKCECNTTALIIAASWGHTDIVDLLLEHEANINHQDEDNDTALIIASENSQTHVIEFLLEKGADTDLEKDDKTAFMIVAEKKHLDVVKIFVEHFEST